MTHALRRSWSLPRACALVALLGACAAPRPEPDTAEAHARRTRAAQAELLTQSEEFARVGDEMRAEQYLALALERGADSAMVTRRLVDACVRGQRYRAAAEHVERHLLRHPRDAELRFVRAVLLLGLDQPTNAARELEQLLAFDSSHALAHFTLGLLQHEHSGDPVSADRHFRAYLDLAPQGAYAERARGLTLRPVPLAGAEPLGSTAPASPSPALAREGTALPTAPSNLASPAFATAAPEPLSTEDVP